MANDGVTSGRPRKAVPEAGRATLEGKPLKIEQAQGRDRHETRLEGIRAEQSARRLRKPEGAAKPGEANPAGRESVSRCANPENVEGPKNPMEETSERTASSAYVAHGEETDGPPEREKDSGREAKGKSGGEPLRW
jgi:hypothetical protein